MISINKKCKYGIIAVMALAESHKLGLLRIRDIASSKGIPRQYLEQIFNRLGNAGIVRSVRGNKGGYELAGDPSVLTPLAVIEALDGGIQLVEESEDLSESILELFNDAEKELKKILEINFTDLVSRQKALEGAYMFHI